MVSGEPIKVRDEQGVRRYSLQGQPLHEDEWIEMKLFYVGWLRVQFSKPATPTASPTGCIAIPVQNSSLPRGILFSIPEQAIFRWPVKEER